VEQETLRQLVHHKEILEVQVIILEVEDVPLQQVEEEHQQQVEMELLLEQEVLEE
jgi:hypothetical protein